MSLCVRFLTFIFPGHISIRLISVKPSFQPYVRNARNVRNARFYATFTRATEAVQGPKHSSQERQGVQVKLWDPLINWELRTRAMPERLRDVFTTRRCTNPRLPYLTLPYLPIGNWFQLTINERVVGLITDAMTGVNVDDCRQHPCSAGPCLNGGYCVPIGDAYRCRCPIGFDSANCEVSKYSSVFLCRTRGDQKFEGVRSLTWLNLLSQRTKKFLATLLGRSSLLVLSKFF